MPILAAIGVSAVMFGVGLLLGRLYLRTEDDTGTTAETSAPMVASVDHESMRVRRGLASLPLGVIIVDAMGEDIFRNNMAADLKRARHADALIEAAVAEVVEVSITGQYAHKELELWGPPPRSLKLLGLPTMEHGECVGATVTIEDTTLETETQRVRRDLVANISHELRTPVGAMVSLSETLEQADDPAVRHRMIERVKTQAIRLSEIVDDLLILAHVEASDTSVFEAVDIASIAGLVLEQASEAAEARGVSLIALNHAKVPVVVDGNRNQLMSVVANLCDNAIKYSPDGSRVVLSVDRDDRSAFITVKDTGVGVPEAEMDRIFERFYRVDTARSRETGGSGLGLAIVRNAIKIHGGTIAVRSVEGRGSTFVAQLPLSTSVLGDALVGVPTHDS